MKIFLVLLLLASPGAFSQSTLARIEQVLRAEFPSNRPGAVVLIAKGDEVVYRKAFGVSDVATQTPLGEDFIFPIGSITKQFTGIAVLQLIRQGKLSASDSLQKYLDYFPFKGHKITIQHLLSQTSGIPEYFDIDEDERQLLTRELAPKDVIQYFKDRPLNFVPGTRFGYSNSNYFLLGAIIEKVTGIRYGDYMRKHVFDPVGLIDTSVWYDSAMQPRRIAKGHPDVPVSGSVLYASGAIVSTVDDLHRWTQAIIRDPEITKGHDYWYGLQFAELEGRKTMGHGGNLYGFTASGLSLLTEEELFVCVLSNAGFQRTEAIAGYIASEMIGKPLALPKLKSVTDLDAFAGLYRLEGSDRTMKVIVFQNSLVLIFPERPDASVPISPVSTDVFESKKVKARLSFVRDSAGIVRQIKVNQAGKFLWTKVDE